MPRPIKPTGRPRARLGGVIRVTIELSAEYEAAAYYYLASSADPYRDTIARALECLAISENHLAVTAEGRAQIELSFAGRAEAVKCRSVQQAQKASSSRGKTTTTTRALSPNPPEPAPAPAPAPLPAPVQVQAPTPAPTPTLESAPADPPASSEVFTGRQSKRMAADID
jgi:hypothetical protein